MQPIEYKKGYTKFFNCKIDLRYKPMIPRKETAFWVKKIVNSLKIENCKLKIDILDIFSGSGCIGIAILKHLKNAHVDFAEIDKNFIKQIKINLKINRINSHRYKVIQSDVFKNIKGRLAPSEVEGYDYIFANPPYIALKNKHLVQKSVLDYESHKVLFGGEDGMFFIEKFLKDARKYLKKDGLPAACLSGRQGKIYMEFDYLQKKELEELLKKLNYKSYKIYKDQFKKWRWLIAK